MPEPEPEAVPGGREGLAAYRAERRAVVRAHHPDRGGDADELQRRLAALERRWQSADGDGSERPTVTVVHSRPLRRAARRMRRRWAGRLRGGLPGRAPGARRYIRVD